MKFKYNCNECEGITILDQEDENQGIKMCEHCMSEDIEFDEYIEDDEDDEDDEE